MHCTGQHSPPCVPTSLGEAISMFRSFFERVNNGGFVFTQSIVCTMETTKVQFYFSVSEAHWRHSH